MEEVRTLGSLLQEMLDLLDAGMLAVYRSDGLDYRPRFTPVMRVLADRGPSSITTIARCAPLTHSAASQTIAQMERLGLVIVTRGNDRRERIASLSEKAEAMLPRIREHWSATARALADLMEETGVPLDRALVTAINALHRKGLRERIAETSRTRGAG
ncbi:MarR family winged helix-turn-helix transcriptional regulator [Erythrobacter donghaensis]|uniref:MarR family winged helix-turn-helix transcriptional regulator n=1 Tax=Erythrobacter donghaensis TaxID=267135 RepID=UPI00093E2FFA|nr:MarR family transcriptional regulator [Erythrobacter donghaensis]